MIRYIQLLWAITKVSFIRATAFRFDFWCRIIMDLVFYAVSLVGFKLIYLQTPMLGGWTESQAMVFIAGYLILDALQMTFISHNLWEFPSDVNTGQFDYTLVRPVSSLFWISCHEVAVNSFINLLFAIGIFIWALSGYDAPISVINLLWYGFFLLNGLFLFFLVRVLFSLPVFWLHSPYTFERIFYSLQPFLDRPHTIFKGWIRLSVMTILPFGLMASLPAYIFFNGVSLSIAINVLIVTFLFASLVLWLWNKALRSYASASS